jgi:hypothetical protein
LTATQTLQDYEAASTPEVTAETTTPPNRTRKATPFQAIDASGIGAEPAP